MSRDGSISFEWADGEYRFRLALGQLCELQEKCNAGPDWVLNRLCDGSWRVDDIFETIRLGLIGGGVDWREASATVNRNITDGNFMEQVEPSISILLAGIGGAPDESPKKSSASTDGPGPLPNGKWRFSIFYGDGAVMGFGADTIDKMSIWQFLAAQGGFERSQGGSSDTGLSDEEFRELSELVDQ